MRPLLLLGLAGTLGLLWWRLRDASSIAGPGDAADAVAVLAMTGYKAPAGAAPYLSAIAAAERKYGIPSNLLVRLLEIECGYRPEVIDGRVKSPTGATGIAQILSSTARQPGYGLRALKVTAAGRAPEDERCNPSVAIPWAAQYLRAMYDRTGSWRQACAAYNQGLGNVLRARGLDAVNWLRHLASEGQQYVARIPDRIGVA